jgi:hypothetical protein
LLIGAGLCPHPVAANRAKISSCETLRTSKNNLDRAAAKAAYREFPDISYRAAATAFM